MAKKDVLTPKQYARRVSIPAGMQITLTGPGQDAFVMSGGVPDPNLEKLLKEEKTTAVQKARSEWEENQKQRDGRKGMDTVARPQTPEEMAEDIIRRADCSYGVEIVIPALIDAINKRKFQEIKTIASMVAEDGGRLSKAIEGAQVMRESFKRIFGN